MLGIERLHLEDALEDSPQMRSMLAVFEHDASQLRKYTSGLHHCCQRIVDAENELAAATLSLSDHLKGYRAVHFPLEYDQESILATTMKQFADTLYEISSWHRILSTQLNDGLLFPLTRFIQADLEEVRTMCEIFQTASNDLEKAISKHCKMPKRKDSDKDRSDRHETNEEVYIMRKKFHQMSLHYYASLNALQYKRKTSLVEPFLGYLHAQRSHFALGNEALTVPDLDAFLTNISASVQGVHSELVAETKRTVKQIEVIENESQHLYHAEPLPDQPQIPANTHLTQKSGYLYVKTKMAGVVNKWDKFYYFTQGGNLMSVNKGELVGCLVLELDNSITCIPLNNEDRRSMFQISNGKKTVILQAVNDRERDEWVATIKNISQDDSYSKDSTNSSKSWTNTSQSFPSSVDESGPRRKSLETSGSERSMKASLKQKSTVKASVSASASVEGFLPSTPIVFDMISPSDSISKSIREKPPVRINPFDQSSSTALAAESLRGETSFHEVYTVRFLGSMEVKTDRGERLVHETIRQIMAARAIHNIFKMTESLMVITNESMRLVDPSNQSVKADFGLQDISFWAAHKENNRLIGFITRSQEVGSEPKFSCHVFESNSSGEEIATSLQTATKIAFKTLMEKASFESTKAKEKELLLENLQRQDEMIERKATISQDGQYLILEQDEALEDVALSPAATCIEQGNKEDKAAESEA